MSARSCVDSLAFVASIEDNFLGCSRVLWAAAFFRLGAFVALFENSRYGSGTLSRIGHAISILFRSVALLLSQWAVLQWPLFRGVSTPTSFISPTGSSGE